MFPRIHKIPKWCALLCMTPDLSLTFITLSQATWFFSMLVVLTFPSIFKIYHTSTHLMSLQKTYILPGIGICHPLLEPSLLLLNSSHYTNSHYLLPLVLAIQSFSWILLKRPWYILMDVYFHGHSFLCS